MTALRGKKGVSTLMPALLICALVLAISAGRTGAVLTGATDVVVNTFYSETSTADGTGTVPGETEAASGETEKAAGPEETEAATEATKAYEAKGETDAATSTESSADTEADAQGTSGADGALDTGDASALIVWAAMAAALVCAAAACAVILVKRYKKGKQNG